MELSFTFHRANNGIIGLDVLQNQNGIRGWQSQEKASSLHSELALMPCTITTPKYSVYLVQAPIHIHFPQGFS